MKDFIFFLHDDAISPEDDTLWDAYFVRLHASGQFDGGSSIGSGGRYRKGGAGWLAALPLVGFLRIRAESLAEAETFLTGNPVYEAGGTVEIRELPRD